MSPDVHPTAVIEGEVDLQDGVVVGPYCVLSGPVRIRSGTELRSGVRMRGPVETGSGCRFYHGCVVGEDPQNWADPHVGDRRTGVLIGSGNVFREHVTVHRACRDNADTLIGSCNRFLVGAHVGHDCRVGDEVVLGNLVQLAGEARVDDAAVLSAGVMVDTAVRIGSGAIIDGSALVLRDVPPFFRFSRRGFLAGIEAGKMKRAGFGEIEVRGYKEILRRLRSGEFWSTIFSTLSTEEGTAEGLLREFLRTSRRGLSCYRKSRPNPARD